MEVAGGSGSDFVNDCLDVIRTAQLTITGDYYKSVMDEAANSSPDLYAFFFSLINRLQILEGDLIETGDTCNQLVVVQRN